MRWRDRPEVAAWWTLATSDLRVARVAVALDPPEWRIACFHAQQAGEKALKALLEARHRPVPRSHDLTLLLQALAANAPDDALLDATVRLTLHGIGPRYPGPTGEASASDACEAIDDAARVVAWVEAALDALQS
jgi:HEPN domain-containing protein